LQFKNSSKLWFLFLCWTNAYPSFAIKHFWNLVMQYNFFFLSCFQPMCFQVVPLRILAIQQCNKGLFFFLVFNMHVSKFYQYAFSKFSSVAKVCFPFLFSTHVFPSFSFAHFIDNAYCKLVFHNDALEIFSFIFNLHVSKFCHYAFLKLNSVVEVYFSFLSPTQVFASSSNTHFVDNVCCELVFCNDTLKIASKL
jgi:hypothetical protein